MAFDTLRRFYRNYTAGVDPAQLTRVIGRDAERAFAVPTRDHPKKAAP